MNAKDFRTLAAQRYEGLSNRGALAFFVYSIVVGAVSGITAGLGALCVGPFIYGFCYYTVQVQRGTEKLDNIFSGIQQFIPTLILYLLMTLYTFLWSLLFFIPGIIKSYAYSMSMYIMIDNPDISASEAISKSVELTQGYKWRLFCLSISYIGWYLLSMLTFGILLFWVMPKVEMAKYEFYLYLKQEKNVNSAHYE